MTIARSMRLVTHAKGPGKGYWVWLRFYETAEELREAAHKHKYWEGYNKELDDTLGCFQPTALRFLVNDKGNMIEHLPPSKCLGIIRIIRGCSYEIVAHEIVHASMGIYRRVIRPNANFWRDCNQSEEEFAYIYGQLFEEFMYQV